MFTQKTLQDLILHHSLEHQGCSVVVLLQALNQVTERLDNIEALLENVRR
jgi:tetrahydromethanopterin S-methyltransferase subunit G